MAESIATIELARRQLEGWWKKAQLNFKYFPPEEIVLPKLIPVPSTKTPKAGGASETAPVKLTEADQFHALFGIPHPPSGTGKSKVPKDGGSSSSASSSASGSGSSSASGSGSGSSGKALSELRKGWVPFGTFPKSDKSKNARPAVQKKKIDKPTGDSLSPVAPALHLTSLPQKLGRSDVFGKRKHKPDRAPADIVVGKNGVHSDALANKMRRGQAYAARDKRATIMLECVEAYRAASR